MSELEALDPVPEQVTLASGTVVQLENLRARQFFKLLRIITHGAVPAMQELFQLDPNKDANAFGISLLTVVALSIPDAEDETIEFIQSMVKPAGLIEGRKLNKQDAERNADLWMAVDTDLVNPELDDLITIIEAIVKRESADIQALGKRLAAMFKLAEKTGQTKPQPKSPSQTSTTEISSADSPEPSTSSPASTDGTTTPSADSPSNDSDSASPQYASAGTSSSGSETNGPSGRPARSRRS